MKFRIRLIHLEAIAIYLVYTLSSKILFVRNLFAQVAYLGYFYQSLFTFVFAMAFLYVFDNEGFFPFAKSLEGREKEREKKMERKYLHFGKALALIVIEILSGPLLGALAAHFLFRRHKLARYLILGSVALLTGPILLILVRNGILLFH